MPLFVRLLLTFAAVGLIVAACSDDGETTANDQISTSATSTSTTTSTSATSTSTTSTSTTTSTSATSTSTEPETTTTEAAATCSASGIERPGPQPELPDPVAEAREAILTAALACDIDGLAALTGPSFTASFGGGEPAEIWTADEEEFGYEPMRALVEILRLSPTPGDDGRGGVAYSWPPAFSYETWEEVPDADRDALRVLYDDADFEGFAQFGGYIGYRTSITENGTWTAFVAGD